MTNPRPTVRELRSLRDELLPEREEYGEGRGG